MGFTERVSILLREKGLNQNKLAESIGVSTSTLNNWLKHGRDIPSDHAIPICEFLGVSLRFGLTGEEGEEVGSSYLRESMEGMDGMREDALSSIRECEAFVSDMLFPGYIEKMGRLDVKKRAAVYEVIDALCETAAVSFSQLPQLIKPWLCLPDEQREEVVADLRRRVEDAKKGTASASSGGKVG